MALHFINISIDAPDVAQVENLNYNEQESIVEFVLEKVLHIENAVPEYDDDDHKKSTLKKKAGLSDFNFTITSYLFERVSSGETRGLSFYSHKITSPHQDIPVPPPKF